MSTLLGARLAFRDVAVPVVIAIWFVLFFR